MIKNMASYQKFSLVIGLLESGCLIVAKLKGGKKIVESRSVGGVFPEVHTIFKTPSTVLLSSNLIAIASYFLHHHLENTMLHASGSWERITTDGPEGCIVV